MQCTRCISCVPYISRMLYYWLSRGLSGTFLAKQGHQLILKARVIMCVRRLLINYHHSSFLHHIGDTLEDGTRGAWIHID